jgi:hypothetical protein
MNILELKRKALGYTFREDSADAGTSSASGIGNPAESAAATPGNFSGSSYSGIGNPGEADFGFSSPVVWGGGSGGGYDGGPGTGVSAFPSFGPNSGVYLGSLSSLGNMVAMALGTGEYQVKIVTAGTTAQGSFEVDQLLPAKTWANLTPAGRAPLPTAVIAPYSVGYIREYWRDPAGTTFGANSAIPALTGVFPDPFTNFGGVAPITDRPGNFVAYADIQMQRLSGSNTWDNATTILRLCKMHKAIPCQILAVPTTKILYPKDLTSISKVLHYARHWSMWVLWYRSYPKDSLVLPMLWLSF